MRKLLAGDGKKSIHLPDQKRKTESLQKLPLNVQGRILLLQSQECEKSKRCLEMTGRN